MAALIDSVTVASADLPASLAFYDAALGALGLGRVVELVDEEEDDPEVEAVGYGDPAGDRAGLWVVHGDSPTTGLHVLFRAGSRSEVETFFRAAVGSGGRAHAAPRRWPIYRRGDFNAIVRDPQGNLVEAVAAE